ncbi:DUF1822 family protein [Calothrix sp. CCY 0018]|uniref:DUF1822 family protein n=1 Tax=Calothrix sp. CCY 0018 TaxID=3103864 RepID=UPI0039C75C77
MSNIQEKLAFTLTIDGKMINIAEKFSNMHHAQKSQEVYLNVLAILAFNFYCQCMEIETDLDKSYGLDGIMPHLINTATLFIKDKGLLECRPVIPKQEFCQIPSEVLSERIGYVVVEIDEDNRQARILGFVESVESEKLPLNQLDSLRDFLTYLHKLEPIKVKEYASNPAGIIENATNRINEEIVKLSKWFDGILDNGWEANLAIAKSISPVETSANQETGAAKFIHLKHPSEPLLLILRQTQLSSNEVEIVLRLYPASESIFLLDGIKMALQDDQDKIIPQLEKQSKASNWLQLKFKGNIGDKFGLKISLEEDSILEKFVV